MEPAPYRADLADAPDGAQAVWVQADDGVRLRIALHRTGGKGTVLVFPGRTEWVEKYGRVVAHLAAMGYSSLVIDWRGQGLSDRLLPDRVKGHVADFPDYQMDVQAALDCARDTGLPDPFFMLAHSMAGAIGLRAVMQDLPVRGAVFSAPMWGGQFPAWARPVAGLLGTVAGWSGMGSAFAPTTGPDPYVLTAPFEDNLLTTDPGAFQYMKDHLTAVPDLTIAGPTMQWVHEAHCECRWLATQPSPALPCLTLLGTNERIVPTAPIHGRMAKWPDGTLVMVPGGEHEVLMEAPDKLDPVLARIEAFFEAHRT
jgi:lysophospholipase